MSDNTNQYVTTAMFLEMEYKPWLNCYIKYHGSTVPETWLDADTMVKLTPSEKMARLMASIDMGQGNDE